MPCTSSSFFFSFVVGSLGLASIWVLAGENGQAKVTDAKKNYTLKPTKLRQSRAVEAAAASCDTTDDLPSKPIPNGKTPDWLLVDEPANPPDSNALGSVDYSFEIMKCEVTCDQYLTFLQAVASESDPHKLWQRAMGDHVITDLGQGGIRMDVPQCIFRRGQRGDYSYEVAEGWENHPVIFVTCDSAMRYANWLHNGGPDEPNADTETGAYVMSAGAEVHRTADAKYWLPSENEWYKAAYYQRHNSGGPDDNYWEFPTCSNEKPSNKNPDNLEDTAATNAAVYSKGFGGIQPVGSYPQAMSPFGALDMGGNVWEWTDDVIHGDKRVLRGGAAAHTWHKMRKDVRSNASPDRWYPDTGFRLARRARK